MADLRARVLSRDGLRARLDGWRASLVTEEDEEMLVRTVELAAVIASALDTDVTDPVERHGSPRVRRYYVAERGEGRVVVGEERGRHRGRFAPGFVARTSSRELADRVARVLNAIDPAVLKPPAKGAGFGWW